MSTVSAGTAPMKKLMSPNEILEQAEINYQVTYYRSAERGGGGGCSIGIKIHSACFTTQECKSPVVSRQP